MLFFGSFIDLFICPFVAATPGCQRSEKVHDDWFLGCKKSRRMNSVARMHMHDMHNRIHTLYQQMAAHCVFTLSHQIRRFHHHRSSCQQGFKETVVSEHTMSCLGPLAASLPLPLGLLHLVRCSGCFSSPGVIFGLAGAEGSSISR